MTSITLLGSTGSIGTSTLDVVRRWPDRFRIFALVAGRNLDLLAEQIRDHRPAVAVVATAELREQLAHKLEAVRIARRDWPELLAGSAGYVTAATAGEAEFVLSAIVGVAGLEATYEAARCGKRIGLANKEALVSAGALLTQAVRDSGAELIPVDSEHNGAHQALRAGSRREVVRLILTASGGPFRDMPASEFANIRPAQALKHPTWQMGPRITIDSATLMNKGFEVIEACWLFDLTPEQIEVVVHPQSTVHAMIEYVDGSVIAQLSATDMRMPIQYALTWPERADAPVPRLDWSDRRVWEFRPPDFDRFPCLRLAYECQKAGGSATCTLNAADEIAVESFLAGRVSFPEIAEVVSETLDRMPVRTPSGISDVLAIDQQSRAAARQAIERRASVRA
ncbi:MAG TPA: 1-deoxy-D-xylulose-5-phosphate reductoisomerase [Bryobacteraceae bacterium]|nr:1-deoxy-D-xylulose-5-phosphate reductoisomerase [Bryobacteraceae bacterium]